jgi:ATP adenylyltransferase/5',5'''-P-1,P-4-tetraphosphate phosphorylase II
MQFVDTPIQLWSEFNIRHAVYRLNKSDFSSSQLTEIYSKLLAQINLNVNNEGIIEQSYNFIMTRRWILIVPRSRGDWIFPSSEEEDLKPLSINAVGWAGLMLIKRQNELNALRALTVSGGCSPLNILQTLCISNL